jgi:hypothetical protein
VVWRRVGGLCSALCLCLAVGDLTSASAQDVSKQPDGTLLIAGRNLRCGNARNVVDPGLPNLGLAAPGILVMNPRLLNRWPATVRLFVFHHECGHHHVGGSELGADCWAVKQGVRQGWLDRGSLQQICRSFGNGPATPTHPAGAARCASLERCFAGAVAALSKERPAPTVEAQTTNLPKERSAPAGEAHTMLPTARSAPAGEAQTMLPKDRSAATGGATAGPAGPDASPKLIQGPTLKRSGMNPN